MAKSSKKTNEAVASEVVAVTAGAELTQTNGTSKPAKQPKTKSAASKTAKVATGSKVQDKPRPAASAKTSAARKARSAKKAAVEEVPSDDDIRIRAYFISEHRTHEGIPGNSTDDWLEARRQLQAEIDNHA